MTSEPSPLSCESLERLGPIALVGHRGAGKSTLGRLVATELGRPFFDLDEEIERRLDITFEADREGFRLAERRLFAELCAHNPAPIIACGAGFTPQPESAFIVWLDRENWQSAVAASDRPRVRSEWDETREWEWMERTRTPLYRQAAHLHLPIPYGRSEARSAQDLATLLTWSADLFRRPLAQKTWLVPTDPADLTRAIRDAERLGFAGVEIRSDVFDDRPQTAGDVDFIASLRHDDPTWLARFPDACAWDVDIQYATDLQDCSPDHLPSRLILSSHPDDLRRSVLDRLVSARQILSDALAIDETQVELKLAPHIEDFDDLDTLLDLLAQIRSLAPRSTVLATSRDFAWTRHIFAAENAANYLPVGLDTRNPDHPTPTDLNKSLPHLAGPTPTSFDALVGDPVDHSQGALWHRRAALSPSPLGGKRPEAQSTRQSRGAFGYLLIPVPRSHLSTALQTLERLPIRGVSVTSPLKREAAQCPRVATSDKLPAINTLRRAPDDAPAPWTGTDTDVYGMIASLKFFESRGIGPGRAVVFGRGGSTHAILRALEQRGWELAAHLSAREGWRPEHRNLEPLDLIVHAAGPLASRTEHTPSTRAWLDLHYKDVAEPPPDILHLQGDIFFDAQAEAQQRFWR